MKKLLLFSLLSICYIQVNAQGWVRVADLPAAWRHHPVCFTLGDTAYVTTGATNANAMLNDFYAYDMANDTWIQKPDFDGPNRGFAVGLNHNGKGYVGFGVSSTNSLLRDLWEFDPVTQDWTQLANLPSTPRYHPAFVANGDKIYVGLGSSGNGNNLNDWWQYDIPTDSWSRKANFIGDQRHHPYYFVVNNEIFVGLGHGTDFSSGSAVSRIYDDWYKYDEVNDAWIQMNNFPGYARVAGAHFAHNGKGYVLGGQNQFHSTPQDNEVWSYDPGNDSWTQLPDCPTGGRWAPGSFLIGNYAFFGFGENIFNVSQGDVWMVSFTDIVSNPEEEESRLSFFPNPATGLVNIDLRNYDIEPNSTIQFYGIAGELVKEIEIDALTSSINISDLSAGVYSVYLNDSKPKGQAFKLIVEQ